MPRLGSGSDRRRKDVVANRLSRSNLLFELRSKVKAAQWSAIDTATGDLKLGLEEEVDNQILDLRSIVLSEGELSECQKYPETAGSLRATVSQLESLQNKSHYIIQHLR